MIFSSSANATGSATAGSQADPINIVDSSDEESPPPSRAAQARTRASRSPSRQPLPPGIDEACAADSDDKEDFMTTLKTGADNVFKEKEERRRNSQRDRGSDSEEEDNRRRSKGKRRRKAAATPQKCPRRLLNDSSESEGPTQPSVPKRRRREARDASPSQAGPSRSFKETTTLGSWSNPAPLHASLSQKPKSKPKPAGPPPGSWANPERLTVKAHAPGPKRRRASPSLSLIPSSGSRPHPSQPRRSEARSDPTPEPSQVLPSFEPSTDPDNPSPPKHHRTTARKSGGGRAPRPSKTSPQKTTGAQINGAPAAHSKLPPVSQAPASQPRTRATWVTAGPGPSSPHVPPAVALPTTDFDDLASGMESGAHLTVAFDQGVESFDELDEADPRAVVEAPSLRDGAHSVPDAIAEAQPTPPVNGAMKGTSRPAQSAITIPIIDDDELENMLQANNAKRPAPVEQLGVAVVLEVVEPKVVEPVVEPIVVEPEVIDIAVEPDVVQPVITEPEVEPEAADPEAPPVVIVATKETPPAAPTADASPVSVEPVQELQNDGDNMHMAKKTSKHATPNGTEAVAVAESAATQNDLLRGIEDDWADSYPNPIPRDDTHDDVAMLVEEDVEDVAVVEKVNGAGPVTPTPQRAVLPVATPDAGPSFLAPALFPSSPDSSYVVEEDDALSDGTPEPEDPVQWIMYGKTGGNIDDPTAPPCPAIPPPSEIPPPGFEGKARRKVNENCRKLLFEWNKSSDTFTENPHLHCSIFEAYVAMSTAGDIVSEPNAPELVVDPSQNAAPPFEFFYTNDMFYTDSVPEPELGQGCGCEGPCDPDDKSCSCVQRQELFFYGYNNGFNYDEQGKLRQSDCAIWECGPKCGCPPECQNRTIQRGRGANVKIELCKTEDRGWGVRAKSHIPANTYIGTYTGEVIAERESERRGRLYDKTDRTYLFDLDGYHLNNPPADLNQVDPRLAELYRGVTLKVDTKDGDDLYSAYSIDAFHFGFSRFFNHSCEPNLCIAMAYTKDFHPERPILAIFTCKDVYPEDELCISYKGQPEVDVDIDMPTPGPAPTRTPKRTPKRGISTKSTASHTGGGKGLKSVCLCGAKKCNGSMFTWERERDFSPEPEDE